MDGYWCVGCCSGAVSQSSDSTDQRWADDAYGHIPIPSLLTSMSAVRSEEPAERDSIQPKASSSTIDKSVCMHIMPIRQSVSDRSISVHRHVYACHSCQRSDGGPDDTHKDTHAAAHAPGPTDTQTLHSTAAHAPTRPHRHTPCHSSSARTHPLTYPGC